MTVLVVLPNTEQTLLTSSIYVHYVTVVNNNVKGSLDAQAPEDGTKKSPKHSIRLLLNERDYVRSLLFRDWDFVICPMTIENN